MVEARGDPGGRIGKEQWLQRVTRSREHARGRRTAVIEIDGDRPLIHFFLGDIEVLTDFLDRSASRRPASLKVGFDLRAANFHAARGSADAARLCEAEPP